MHSSSSLNRLYLHGLENGALIRHAIAQVGALNLFTCLACTNLVYGYFFLGTIAKKRFSRFDGAGRAVLVEQGATRLGLIVLPWTALFANHLPTIGIQLGLVG